MKKEFVSTIILILWNISNVFGYRIFYMKESGSCSGRSVEINMGSHSRNSSGILRSGDINEPGLNCSIYLRSPLSYGVVVSIRNIDLAEDCENYLEISPVEHHGSAKLCGYSNDQLEFQSYVSWTDMRIEFHSSNYTSLKKASFQLTFTAVRSGDGGFCFREERRCHNQYCIWKGLTCDGHNNCGDLSDEIDKHVSQCDSPSDSNQRRDPFIDGQPIFIPEEPIEISELRKKESDKNIVLDETKSSVKLNQNVSDLNRDGVFLVDQRKYLKQKPSYTKNLQNPAQNLNKQRQETEKDSEPESNSNKRTENFKQTNKLKKVPETKEGHLTESQNILMEEVYLSLRDKARSMFGPNFESFVFNPLVSESKFQECKTSKNESGVCRSMQHCFLPNIVSSLQQFMNDFCIIEKRFIGVCCPHFPIEAVSIKWQVNQETFDDQVKTPKECGVGTNTRIVGGSNADIKAWPWMVALMDNKKFFCGGALINNRYILTAAHCTFGVKRNKIIARLGEFDLSNDQGEDYRVVEIKRHGQYNRFTLRNDVALLKLEKPVTFNEFIKTVCFPDQTKNYTGKIATSAGWGRLQGGVSSFTSDVLQEVEFPIVTNEECAHTHGLPIPESLICTSAPSKDRSACNGDSGGPLMLLDDENRWKVVGIVSWGRRGCNTNFPSVFTRVTYYLDWIKQHAI